ncbi:IclR family transcriptional regulator [Pseudonocardia sp. MH-G8]|uniref:IclR family transcriptional regulator n=1 Tax=Pseudonocardia sp. MH-G8 TaxID=1854588 RepID=UPI000BA10730|nr:IclR family transcriptional regulator [Pseudonocardia sp. MH-G8]OZM80862.1 IclR family transcriptional regulator [Pseudonocardia sp. MH-G8]
MGRPEPEDTDVLLTLQRGMRVFEHLVQAGPQTAKQLASALGLRLGSCYHVLRTLVADGYAERDAEGRYRIGARTFALGRHLQQRNAVAPELSVILTRLHNASGETSYISQWRDGAVVLSQFLTGNRPIRVGNLEIGYCGDMHARASCKAVLASLPVEQVDTIFAGLTLRRLTPGTVTDYDELTVELAAIRRQGYAVDREEFAVDVCCVAAPFFGADGAPRGSFTVSVPHERFGRDRDRLLYRVREAADMATSLLRSGRLVVPDDPTHEQKATVR